MGGRGRVKLEALIPQILFNVFIQHVLGTTDRAMDKVNTLKDLLTKGTDFLRNHNKEQCSYKRKNIICLENPTLQEMQDFKSDSHTEI